MLARGLTCSAPSHSVARQKLQAVRSLPAVAISPHRVSALPRVRTVCWSATTTTAPYASFIFNAKVQEYAGSFTVSQYDDTWDSKLEKTVDKISANKQKLKAALKAHEERVGDGVGDRQRWEARKTLMLAMAMQESNHMDVRQRDDTKDWDPYPRLSKAANCSIFNLSVDFVEMSGYYTGRPGPNGWQELPIEKFNFLNTDAGLPEAVGILECAFQEWGIENTLAFVRQGRSGFNPQNKGVSWRMMCGFDGVAGQTEVSKQPPAYAFNICEYLCCIKRGMRYIDEHPEVWDNADRPDIPCRHI